MMNAFGDGNVVANLRASTAMCMIATQVREAGLSTVRVNDRLRDVFLNCELHLTLMEAQLLAKHGDEIVSDLGPTERSVIKRHHALQRQRWAQSGSRKLDPNVCRERQRFSGADIRSEKSGP